MPLTLAESLPQVDTLFKEGIEEKLHAGAQIYVSQQGVPLACEGVGWPWQGLALPRIP